MVRPRPPSPCITTLVPYHNPIPEKKQRGKDAGTLPTQKGQGGLAGGPGIIGAWVQAEKMMQIVLLLPCAAFIGWLLGYWLDHILHQSWIAMIGIVVGIISGLVGAVRMAMVYGAGPKTGGKNGNGTEGGSSDSQP